jgi:hypothetical protein
MSYATLPPVAEYRQQFKREADRVSKSAWHRPSTDAYSQGGWWRDVVFSRVSKFVRDPAASNLGTFNITEEVARKVRSQLYQVSIQSLPLAAVIPLSGHGITLTWVSGDRSVEMTAYADGDITIEPFDAGQYVDLTEEENLEAALSWLVDPTANQLHHASAR